MNILLYGLCLLGGYLLGSVSTGVLISRRLGRDIRTMGSGNTGSSNMERVYGRGPGTLTFMGDCLKAALAVIAACLLTGGREGGMLAGLGAVLGHNWPLFFGFRGGKGIASATAAFVLLFPLQGAMAVAVYFALTTLSRYISLGSMGMMVTYAVHVACMEGLWPAGAWAAGIALLGIWRHRGNISRLLKGTERKMGERESI